MQNNVWAIVNQKGGCGKTTTAINLAYSLTYNYSDIKVLVVDLDPQGNATTGLGLGRTDESQFITNELCISKMLYEKRLAKEHILHTPYAGIDLIPATNKLCSAEIVMNQQIKREERLSLLLTPILHEYDVILLDAPPNLGILTTNAICLADHLILPIDSSSFAVDGVYMLLNNINIFKEMCNEDLEIDGILLTMYEQNSTIVRKIEKDIYNIFNSLNIKIYNNKIPKNIHIKNSQYYGQPIGYHMPDSAGAISYNCLSIEIFNNILGKRRATNRQVR